MRAALDDPSVGQHHDLLGQRDGRGAVGDDEGGAALHDLHQRPPDLELGLGVDARGGVVQDQYLGVDDERPGNGDALALAARQGQSALADDGLVALRQGLDEGCRLGAFGRLADLGVARPGASEADVLGDRGREQKRVLGDDADVAAQVGQAHVAHVVAVDQHAAGGGVVEARHQVGERRLAAAGVAHQRDRAAGRHLEIDVFEHGPVDIRKRDALEAHLAGHAGQGRRVGALDHLDGCVQDLVDAGPRGDGALRQAGQPADHLGRVDQQHEVAVERHEAPQAEAAVDDLATAYVEQHDDRQVGQKADQRYVDSPDAGGADLGLEDPRAAVGELGELVVLAGEDAHDARAGHVLFSGRGDVGDLLLHVAQDGLQAAAEADGGEQQQRQERQAEQGELPVQHEHQHRDGDHREEVGGEEDQAVAQEHAHVLDVGHGARHELAGGPAVEVAERLAQQVGPHPVAQVVLDGEADLAGRQATGHGEAETHGADGEQCEPVPDQQAGLAGRQGLVDDSTREPRDGQRRGGLQQCRAEAHEDEPGIVAEQLGDAPEGLHS